MITPVIRRALITLPESESVVLSEPESLAGLFWLDPARIDEVGAYVNSASEATMALAQLTKREDFRQARQDTVDSLFPLPAAMHEIKDQLARVRPLGVFAVETGFLYGSLMHPTLITPGSEPIPIGDPKPFLESVKLSGLNPKRFSAMRYAEMAITGSDVLGYGLARTQDHISKILSDSRVVNPNEHLEPSTRESLQSLYYAGALAGAFAVRRFEGLPMPPVEITRSIRNLNHHPGALLQHESDDTSAKDIHLQLTNRYRFEVGRDSFGHYISAYPGMMQVLANGFHLPVGMFEPQKLNAIHAKHVDGILVRTEGEADGEIVYRYKNNPKAYIKKFYNGEIHDEDIVGVMSNKQFVGAIDEAHPWWPEVAKMICREAGIEDFNNINELEMSFLNNGIFSKLLLSKWSYAIGLGAPWGYEAMSRISNGNGNLLWPIGSDLAILAMVAIAKKRQGGLLKAEKELLRIDQILANIAVRLSTSETND